jgi:sec-independent protein translocase protein TatB
MFDIGFSELFLIAVVALLVLGPERLPKAARFAGLWMRRARAQWYTVKSELEHELAAEELKRSLRETQDELRNAHTHLQREGASLHEEVGAATRLDASTGLARDAGALPVEAVMPEAAAAGDGSDIARSEAAPSETAAADEPSRSDAPALRDER